MTREELIKKVALKMDEISSSDDIIVSVNSGDNNPLYTQINGLLNESVNDVLTKAPAYRIVNFIVTMNGGSEEIKNSTGEVVAKVATFSIPEGFIRLTSITDSLFKRPVVDVAIEGDEVSKRQHNLFLMAKKAKPVAVLERDSAGERIVRCYSYGKDDTPNATMTYIKRFDGATELSSEITIDDYLADIVSWTCAGRVFAAHGDVSKGQLCDNNASALMV